MLLYDDCNDMAWLSMASFGKALYCTKYMVNERTNEYNVLFICISVTPAFAIGTSRVEYSRSVHSNKITSWRVGGGEGRCRNAAPNDP